MRSLVHSDANCPDSRHPHPVPFVGAQGQQRRHQLLCSRLQPQAQALCVGLSVKKGGSGKELL